jgi:hypothetical protein
MVNKPSKPAVKRTSVRNTVSRRTTNRTQGRPAALFVLPPTGDLEAIAEAAVKHWIAREKRKSDYLHYQVGAVMGDGREMVEDRVADLRRFAEQQIPIGARELDYLEIVMRKLEECGVTHRLGRAKTEAVREDVRVAMAAVIDARSRLAARAVPNGIPLSLFDIRQAMASPRALYAAVVQVIDAATEVAEDFDSPTYARKLIKDLEQANNVLGDLAGVRTQTKVSRRRSELRKQALARILYDHVVFLSAWGKAMAGGDREAQRRWRLDKTFPRQDRLPPEDGKTLASKVRDDVVPSTPQDD